MAKTYKDRTLYAPAARWLMKREERVAAKQAKQKVREPSRHALRREAEEAMLEVSHG